MPGVAVAQAIAIRDLISQQPIEKQKTLFMLLELQENYKNSFFWFNKKKAKQKINEIYPKYKEYVKILKDLYECVTI